MSQPGSFPEFNAAFAADALIKILRAEVLKTGIKKAVLGVSGGVDSALSLALAAEALGKENVLAVMMPYKTSNPNSLGDATKLCQALGIATETVEITPMADAYFARGQEGRGPASDTRSSASAASAQEGRGPASDTRSSASAAMAQEGRGPASDTRSSASAAMAQDMSATRKGNVMARLRMIVLYDISARDASLVIGTSNKTEILLGYSTLWGDMASAVNPLGDLYKYQVFAVSKHLRVIPEILDKAPSADLWSGQTDEAEMGFSYAMADLVLYYWLERNYTVAALKEMARAHGQDEAVVDNILRRVQRNAYKRQMPVIAKISPVTIGREFRTARDWGM